MPAVYRAARADEFPAVDALCQSCISVVAPGYFLARFTGDPTILPGGILVAEEDGRLVASVTAHGFLMRHGGSTVPLGGIANVVTDPAHRGRGHARALLDAAHRLFGVHALPASLLSTEIPAFYRPLGYEVWEREGAHLLSLTAPQAPPDRAVRPIDWARDRGALIALHDTHDMEFTGPLVRSVATWERCRTWTALYPKEDAALALLAEDSAGRPAAYLRAHTDPAGGWSVVLEFAARPGSAEAVEALARAYAREAVARGVRGIQAPAPCRDLIGALTPHVASATTVTYATLMVRTAPQALLTAGPRVFWDADAF